MKKEEIKEEKEIPIFIDYSVNSNCLNKMESYGEICVKCGKCGRKFKNGIMIKED